MVASETILQAWAVPAWFSESPFDHTWVTDFDNRTAPYATIADVVAAGKNNWFCWGDFHPNGGAPDLPDGSLGSIAADMKIATCLVEPNVVTIGNPPAQGTIFHYGVDGVCHQLANQVLWSSVASNGGPLTVNQARGYEISNWLFGTYGRLDTQWQDKIHGCSPTLASAGALPQPMKPLFADDEFERHARRVLASPEAADRLQQVLALRGTARQTAESMRARLAAAPALIPPSGAELNAHYNEMLRQAAEILTAHEYVALFKVKPGEIVNMVDPTMVPKTAIE